MPHYWTSAIRSTLNVIMAVMSSTCRNLRLSLILQRRVIPWQVGATIGRAICLYVSTMLAAALRLNALFKTYSQSLFCDGTCSGA